MLAAQLEQRFDGEIIAGADRAAGEHGFVIVSADSERRADDPARRR